MISGSLAKSNTDTTTGSLSYINDLITGATTSGSYNIVVPRLYMNEAMAVKLRTTYGYNVSKRHDFMGTNDSYLISWGNNDDPTPTPTSTPTATPTVTPKPATATPTPTSTNTPTDTPTPTPSSTPTMTPTALPVTSTPTPTITSSPATSTPTPAPTASAYAYNYSISATDLAAATGNTVTSNNNAVFATTTQDENGSPATRKFTVAGSAYNHWLCSAAGITPTFGYYKDNVLVTVGLLSTQTRTGAC